ncbi:formyl transferase [Rhizobium oryzicola]|uniref:phosphoribosylglycinamide formyltransferase 1 n=1 Tax=Rhizobium oryzicola TaxID=1232668 RepID=A0ABT8T0U8_9HYPH|nr:formyl transferase [Rhizobium oryzicola]MDO1584384.1 formyl transferase [Rhizobium oryzicola]
MINALAGHFPNLHVIEEQYETKSLILKRRARRLGWPTAFGQLATMAVSRLGKTMAQRRTEEILRDYGLSGKPHPDVPITRVNSINDADTIESVRKLRPAVVFTISCRILKASTIEAIPCPIINFHAGINPTYRGQMGGYWARVERDEENFGATVHLVDAGIDTGATLKEARVRPARTDTISTYPLLITAAGTEAAIRAIEDVLEGRSTAVHPTGRSVLRFPPPVWTYLFHGLKRGIW